MVKSDTLWYKGFLKKSDVILDLGCGLARDIITASRRVKKAIGVDIDQNQLDVAVSEAKRMKLSNLRFLTLDANNRLPFKNESFDKIIASDILEHLDRRDYAIGEIKRVLKNKGLLFLVVDNPNTWWKRLQKSYGLFYYADPDHKYEYPKEEILNILKKRQFFVLSCEPSTYDTPLKGLIDLIGGMSLSLYKVLSNFRKQMAAKHSDDTTGYMIVARLEK